MSKENSTDNLENFLLNIPPEKLSQYCSSDEKITKICADENFVKKYTQLHKKDIRKRVKLSDATFTPKVTLPEEKAPEGYKVMRKWHWAYEVWASNEQYKGYNRGEVPHFNIQENIGGPMYHVYIKKEYPGYYLVIDYDGSIIFYYI